MSGRVADVFLGPALQCGEQLGRLLADAADVLVAVAWPARSGALTVPGSGRVLVSPRAASPALTPAFSRAVYRVAEQRFVL